MQDVFLAVPVVHNTEVAFKFEGNLPGLIETLKTLFKDPDVLSLHVTVGSTEIPAPPPVVVNTRQTRLVKEIIRVISDNTRNVYLLHDDLENEVAKALPEIIEAIESDRRIPAMKLIRAATGCGLIESKTVIDSTIPAYLAREKK